MTLTRIVAQLDYKHTHDALPPATIVDGLNAILKGFSTACPGLDVVLIGYADADDTPPELSLVSFEHYAETRQKQKRSQRQTTADNGERSPD